MSLRRAVGVRSNKRCVSFFPQKLLLSRFKTISLFPVAVLAPSASPSLSPSPPLTLSPTGRTTVLNHENLMIRGASVIPRSGTPPTKRRADVPGIVSKTWKALRATDKNAAKKQAPPLRPTASRHPPPRPSPPLPHPHSSLRVITPPAPRGYPPMPLGHK